MVAMRDYTNAELLQCGLEVIGHHVVGSDDENHQNFKAAYGVNTTACAVLWRALWDSVNPEIIVGPASNLFHLFWALHFLRAYPLERNMAAYFRVSRRTLTKWTKVWVHNISLLKAEKIVLPEPIPDVEFYLSVDGTDCPINEPTPFNRNWMSHKFKGAAIKYEIGIDLDGNYAWVSPPYRGSVHDSTIFKRALRNLVPDGCCVIVDSAYGIEDDKVAPVSEYDDAPVTDFKKRVKSRHETGNKRIKDFAITSTCFRHQLDFHSACFDAVVVLCQFNVENGENLFVL